MRDQTDSRTLPLSLGKPAQKRAGQSGAAVLPPLSPCAYEAQFREERAARQAHCSHNSARVVDGMWACGYCGLWRDLESRAALLDAFELSPLARSGGAVA
jgi:hypothetical protein